MHTCWIPIKSQPTRSPPSVKMQGTEELHSVRVQGECLAFQRGGKQLYPFLILMTKLLLDLVCLEIMAPNPLKFMVLWAPSLPLLLQVPGIGCANLCHVDNLTSSAILRRTQLHVSPAPELLEYNFWYVAPANVRNHFLAPDELHVYMMLCSVLYRWIQ
nr:uncharacterized protein LOC118034117 [Populus alba]